MDPLQPELGVIVEDAAGRLVAKLFGELIQLHGNARASADPNQRATLVGGKGIGRDARRERSDRECHAQLSISHRHINTYPLIHQMRQK